MKNCPRCGTPLIKTNYDRDWCPNCGVVEEPKEVENPDRSYIR